MRILLFFTLVALAAQAYSIPLDYEFASIDDIFQYGVEKLIDSVKEINNKVGVIVQQNKDNLQRKTWEQFRNILDKVSRSAYDLQPIDERTRDLYSIETEESANVIIENFTDYALGVYGELRFNNEKNHDLAKQLVVNLLEDYVNTYTGIINQCADENKFNLLSFDRTVQSVTNRYRNIIGTLTAQIEKCQQTGSLTCLQAITLQFRTLTKAPRDMKALTLEGNNVNVNFSQNDCVIRALEESHREQSELGEKIQKIVDQSNSGNDDGVYDV